MKKSQAALQFIIVLGIIFVSLCAFRLGFYFAARSHGRQPAAIPRIYDYSHLTGSALLQAAHERLIKGTKIVSVDMAVGLELGNFMARSSSGQAAGACEIYGQIELTFQAGDMAVSGSPSEMKITGPCEPADDIHAIAPIMIPYEKILKRLPRDSEITDFADAEVKVTFHNISDAWPRIWVVESVRLISPQFGEIKASKDDFRKLLGKAPSLEWR